MTGEEAATGGRGRVPYEYVLLLAPLFILASGLSIVSQPSLAWLTTWGTTIVFLIGMGGCAWRARAGGAIGRTWRWFTLACAL